MFYAYTTKKVKLIATLIPHSNYSIQARGSRNSSSTVELKFEIGIGIIMTSKPHKKIALKEALKTWEDKYGRGEQGKKIGDQLEIKFNGWSPPIEKMDNSTAAFTKCEFLSISTNMIERLTNLNYMNHLRVLSVGRNFLKTLSGVEACADTLEEIWASYNQIEKPTKGILSCKRLRKIYLGNNWIREWPEVTKLNELPDLEELGLIGNPLYDQYLASGNELSDWQHELGTKIKQLKKLDGYNIVLSTGEPPEQSSTSLPK